MALIRLFLSLSNFCFMRWCIVMTYEIHIEHTLLRSSWLCNMYSTLSSEIPIYSSIILTVMGDYHLSVSPPLQFFCRQQFREKCCSQRVISYPSSKYFQSAFRQCIGSFNNSQLLVKFFVVWPFSSQKNAIMLAFSRSILQYFF